MFSRVIGSGSRFSAGVMASRSRLPTLVLRVPRASLHTTKPQPVVLRRAFSTDSQKAEEWEPFDAKHHPPGFESDFSVAVPFDEDSRKIAAWREQNPQETFKSIVAKYGVYPLAGLASVALFSKEIIPLGEEFILLVNFAAMIATLHVYGGKELFVSVKDSIKREKKNMWDWDQFKIDLVDDKISDVKVRLQAPSVYEEYVKEYVDVAQSFNVAETVKPKHEFRATTLKRLQDILNQELDLAASEKKKITLESVAFVRQQLQERADLRTATVNQAIDSLGAGISLGKSNPIVGLFNQFLQTKGKKPIA